MSKKAIAHKDIAILRNLASRYMEICNKEEQTIKRNIWREHNSLKDTPIPIYVRGWPSDEVPKIKNLLCNDPFYRQYEHTLRWLIYQDSIGDDYVLEPWITVMATCTTPQKGIWGVEVNRTPSHKSGGSWAYDPPLKTIDDIDKLIKPRHVIDDKATDLNASRLQDAIGDIIEINIDRRPVWFMWNADISTNLAYLRGLEQVMWDMIDNPDWLHSLLAFMRDGILAAHEQAEIAGDWRLCDHQNQAMPYAQDLPDPCANSAPVTRDKIWTFAASQELTLVSPKMHDEFMLEYQIPILEKFGLSAYGCCEDLTEKIDILRRIPNLRRIAVAPRANVQRCAEQMGRDYVFSYRPNPAEMVCCGFDPDHIRKVIKTALDDSKGCCVDITLKDIQTVENQPERLRKWVDIVRDVCSS